MKCDSLGLFIFLVVYNNKVSIHFLYIASSKYSKTQIKKSNKTLPMVCLFQLWFVFNGCWYIKLYWVDFLSWLFHINNLYTSWHEICRVCLSQLLVVSYLWWFLFIASSWDVITRICLFQISKWWDSHYALYFSKFAVVFNIRWSTLMQWEDNCSTLRQTTETKSKGTASFGISLIYRNWLLIWIYFCIDMNKNLHLKSRSTNITIPSPHLNLPSHFFF